MGKIEEFSQTAELRESLARTQRQLRAAKAKTDEMVAAATRAAVDAVRAQGPIPPVTVPRRDQRRKDPEVALWHLTDWQGSKLTTTYNREVMRDRVLQYVRRVTEITGLQRADHPVRECVIAFGGDMLEGLFNFPTQPFEVDATLFDQLFNVGRLLVETVRAALSIYQTVTVVAEWGNHGRVGSKRDAVPRSDNFDRMAYEHARQILAGESRLTWLDCPEDIQRIEVGNYRALLIHGDEVGRGGFASPMTISQHCNRWRSGAYPWAFRDVYVGHYHTHMELSLADGLGAVYWTGSLESDNRYARDTMAASAKPSQRLHFVDPVAGAVTAQYKIWTD